MPHNISLHQGSLAQQVGMVAKIQTAFRHLIRPRASRAKPSSSARLWAAKCAYSPECVEGEFCELRIDGVLRSSGQNSYSTSAQRPVEYSQHSGYRASLPPPEAPGPGTALRTGPSAQLRLSARTIASPVLLLSLFTQRLRSKSVLRSFELASSTRPAGTSSASTGNRVRRRSWPAQLPCLPHYEASRTRS